MSQVSRRQLIKEVENGIYEIFWGSIALCRDKDAIVSFFENLLTPTEKITLAKRISIALLISKNYNYETISKILKVSRSTIWTVKRWLNSKDSSYSEIIGKISREAEIEKNWQKIDSKIKNLFLAKPKKGKFKGKIQWEVVKKKN